MGGVASYNQPSTGACKTAPLPTSASSKSREEPSSFSSGAIVYLGCAMLQSLFYTGFIGLAGLMNIWGLP